ncbi:MAG: kelch repeat-containing protein [Bacteroidota bacterium]|nr:kelch repeat-containing protein [Bacteroidota bacterium]
MKKIILSFFVLFTLSMWSQSQGNWTWMAGYDTLSCYGNYGVKGVASTSNTPRTLYETCSWKDNSGNFWLFGGTTSSGGCLGNLQGVWSDMWKYNPSTNQWTWVKGPGIKNTNGFYGTKSIPSSSTTPGGRAWGISTWIDNNGKFWLYGGAGFDAFGIQGALSDLWKFDPITTQWTWVHGPNTANNTANQNALANYGTMGVPSTSNNPPAIHESNCTWVDASNNLWLYGGMAFNGGMSSFNALWKYNISTDQWTWVWGSQTVNIAANYGTKGVESPTNNPGGRSTYCSFISQGKLFLYGGIRAFSTSEIYNDIWSYNTGSGNWKWEDGLAGFLTTGTMQTLCDTTNYNFPNTKQEDRSNWTDTCGFYLYGGFNVNGGTNELWYYNAYDKKFKWLKGPGPVQHGTKGIPSPNNLPSSRSGASVWKDQQGNLWMWGGLGGTPNDNAMWKYTINPSCQTTCQTDITTNLDKSSLTKSDTKIFPNPNSGNFTVWIESDFIGGELKLLNAFGEIIYENKITDSNYTFNNLSKGIYFLKINGGKKVIIKKIIVQ